MKMKQEAAGWPEGGDTNEKKKAYIDEYLQKENITLDALKISENAGFYATPKISLNSLWGKFCQKISGEYCQSKILHAEP